MRRSQISLGHGQYRLLATEAKRRGMSVSALIHSLVGDYFKAVAQIPKDPLEAVAGIGTGTGECAS